MKYLSLFSGIGGFELGIQQAYESNSKQQLISEESQQEERSQRRKWPTNKHDQELRASDGSAPLCVGYSEIDKYAIQIYEKHFNHKNYGDITKINETELLDFDLLVGGFPCQSFSIAGKRGGFNDTRGTMFFEIARIIKHKQPRLLLLENVKGLLSHDEGRTFATIIATLDELGYDLQWQVLNSKNFGVPQNRERVFIIGHLRGTTRPEVFPFAESNGTYLEEITQGVSDAQRIYNSTGIGKTLKGLGGGLGAKTGLYSIRTSGDRGKQKTYLKENEIQTLSSNPMSDNIPRVTDKISIRRLTPIECARLQGFPDKWHDGVSDSQAYKCYGNAVTVNVIQAIVEKLLTS